MSDEENPVQTAERHLGEGAKRIAKQDALIRQLEGDGDEVLLPEARELLEQMRELQRASQWHLDYEKGKPLQEDGGEVL
ncbi:hypothetical protein VQH23_16385 [Pararoseomonas sp. SCSIO 73927]|uniref:hypothetical protein n=1 Tax=Pararoseomonas sp. SCSIO 73927 TaxID=3114537 RepID=UPI0030CC0466